MKYEKGSLQDIMQKSNLETSKHLKSIRKRMGRKESVKRKPNQVNYFKCLDCKQSIRIRNLRDSRCYNCYMKISNKMPYVAINSYTLEEALNKVYNVYFTLYNGKPSSVRINIPKVLMGRKVRLILVDEEIK